MGLFSTPKPSPAQIARQEAAVAAQRGRLAKLERERTGHGRRARAALDKDPVADRLVSERIRQDISVAQANLRDSEAALRRSRGR